MSKKSLIISVVLGAFVLLGAGMLFVFREKESKSNIPTNDQVTSVKSEPDSSSQEKDTSLQERDDTTVFVTDVDPDVNHWQTKETEFFTIKFPKEWYWMESSHKKDEGYSKVITNNPRFDIEKYADIGIGAGMSYPLTLANNTEVVITMSGVAGTAEEGSAVESINRQLERVRTFMNPNAVCSQNNTDVPYPTAQCSFIDENNQSVHIYFVAEKSVTYAFTARTTQGNTVNVKKILEDISKSYIVPEW